MKKCSLLAVSSIAMMAAAPAFAGGYEPPVVETPVVAAVVTADSGFNWAGGYGGVTLGYAGDKMNMRGTLTQPAPPSQPVNAILADDGDATDPATNQRGGSVSLTSSGFVGGITGGWNWQSGSMVYGVEGDLNLSNVKGEAGFNFAAPDGSISGKAGIKLKSYATLRGRVGHLVNDRFMVYGTAGVASGKTEGYASLTDSVDPDMNFNDSYKKTMTGWTAGIGAEYAINDRTTLKSEYLYTDLGKKTLFDGAVPETDGLLNAKVEQKVKFHTVRVGLNFQF